MTGLRSPSRRSNDRSVQMGGGRTPIVGSVPVGVDGTSRRRQPVATTVGGGVDRRGGIEPTKPARTAKVFGVAVVVHGSVSQQNPIALPVRSPSGRRHGGALDARRTEVGSVAERVDVAVARRNPVALTGSVVAQR